jgi:respiratory burst oxidase
MMDSKEFANELFDALVRRKSQQQDMMILSHAQQQQQQQQQHCFHCISKDELYEYWLQITDKSFDSRMRIFFAL